jgi:hypothetical protein
VKEERSMRPTRPNPFYPAHDHEVAATPSPHQPAAPAPPPFVPANPYAPPRAPFPAATDGEDDVDPTLGMRVAGAMLLASAVLGAFELAAGASTSVRDTLLGIVFNVIIGRSLLMRRERWRTWAMIRAAAWVVLSIGDAATHDSPWPVVVNGLVAGALVTLLVGRAGTVRVIVGCALFAAFALLEIAGLALGVR